MKIRKAVIPAAGFGTRFLPQTKAMPKEMLPIVDKPTIQYVVEDLIEAGIEDIIIVTGYHKRGIEDHFDVANLDLIENLKMGGTKKVPLLKMVEEVSSLANFYFVRQKGPYGNGTPLLNVRNIVGDEPFAYTWADEFFTCKPSRYSQLVELYNKYQCSIIGCRLAERPEDGDLYGFAGGDQLEPGVIDCKMLVEKPGKGKAPSSLVTAPGVIWTANVFEYVDKALESKPEGAEFYWNDVAKLMINSGERIIAAEVKNAKYHDTGNKLEYMKTVVEFALKHPDLNGEFRNYLKSLDL